MRRTLAVAMIAASAFRLVRAEDAPRTVLLRGGAGPEIEVLGPDGGRLGRTVSTGWSVALAGGRPHLAAVSGSQVLVAWNGPGGSAVSLVEAAGGALREVWSDAFEPGWSIQPSGDFNRDGRPDFLLVKSQGEGDERSYSCAVAVWDREKGIDLVTDPVTVVPRCRGAYFTSGDMDGDGAADVVFHSFDYGGSFETQLCMLKGHGDGTVDAEAKKVLLLTSPHAASTPVLGDLDGDGDLDVLLPPDDDVGDEGQCHVAFNRGDGTMEKLRESVDFRPENEADSSDTFFASAFLADTDGDGMADLVARCDFIADKAWEIRIHRGIGGGEFDAKGRVLESGAYAQVPMPSIAWIAWPGRDAQPAAGEPPPREDLDRWWTALGSKKPRDVARAMGAFLRAGAAVVPFLAEHVPAPAELDTDRVDALIRDLDADDFRTREKASAALHGLADVAEDRLRAALDKTSSAEVRMRLGRILEARPEGALAQLRPEDAALLRTLAVLEAIGTAEAREAIARLASPNVPLGVRHAAAEAVKRAKR
ncbi:MAG: VCBS repeat-containing protein [Planctomycetia bacterium]|nr:VCBS repeat-containing protein [Planctomycetia bacterium]